MASWKIHLLSRTIGEIKPNGSYIEATWRKASRRLTSHTIILFYFLFFIYLFFWGWVGGGWRRYLYHVKTKVLTRELSSKFITTDRSAIRYVWALARCGDIAPKTIWQRMTVTIKGCVSEAGYNVLSNIKFNDEWLILSLTELPSHQYISRNCNRL